MKPATTPNGNPKDAGSSDPGLRRLANIVKDISGIDLRSEKDFLIETRLRRRVSDLDLPTIEAYADLVTKDKEELQVCIELLTTHKTEWFREIVHFQWLKKQLPNYKSTIKPFQIWSAACSSGLEVYSLLFQLLKEGFNHTQFRILGTDISRSVLDVARRVVEEEHFGNQRAFLLKHVRDPVKTKAELELALEKSIKFREHNLTKGELSANAKFDVIFLRNVLIYFDRPTVHAVCHNLSKNLKPGGHLVLGLSESLNNELPELASIGNSIYEFRPRGMKYVSGADLNEDTVSIAPVKKTRIMIVEDSKPIQSILNKVYNQIPNVEIVATESDAEKAARLVQELKPHFISLDMKLENGTGIDFLKLSNFREYARSTGAKCVLVTDCSIVEGNLVFDAMAAGASSYIQKPQATNLNVFAADLAEMLTAFFPKTDVQERSNKPNDRNIKNVDLNDFQLIAIGSSTGGTEVVRDLIGGLPRNCPPIVVVQHMPEQFTGLYSHRIQVQTGRPTIEVKESTELLPDHAYIASGGAHMVIERDGRKLYANSQPGELVNRFKPSVSVMFNSIHKLGLGAKTAAIILTGMGHDGAKELKTLKDDGALTIGQSKESCVVYGMPRAASELGALCWSGSPEQIIYNLSKRANNSKTG